MAGLKFRSIATAAVIAAGLAACTVHKQAAPGLTGPSELGTSIVVSVSPDVLAQDGASQSIITITARDSHGQPIRNLSLRADITLNGVISDFGSLSAKSVTTDANGRATIVYTAPAAPAIAVDNGTIVAIEITPLGSDFGNAAPRTASIRLVPPVVVAPPDGFKPSFIFSPATPAEGDRVLFDASASTSNAQNPITSYSWNFGDGRTGSGVSIEHAFSLAGNYTVTLTIGDAFGRTASLPKQLTVAGAARPVALFTFSPNPSQLNQPIHFNASGSTASPGRRIVTYSWDFGDGSQQTTGNAILDHVYTVARTYVVTLIVTDDQGKSSLAVTQSITPQ